MKFHKLWKAVLVIVLAAATTVTVQQLQPKDPTLAAAEGRAVIGLHGGGGGLGPGGFGSGADFPRSDNYHTIETTDQGCRYRIDGVEKGGVPCLSSGYNYNAPAEVAAYLNAILTAEGIKAAVVHGFSYGGGMALSLSAHGETLEGRLIGIIADDPAFYGPPQSLPLKTKLAVYAAWDGDSYSVDDIQGIPSVAQIEQQYGVDVQNNPAFNTHHPVVDDGAYIGGPPEISTDMWWGETGTPPPDPGRVVSDPAPKVGTGTWETGADGAFIAPDGSTMRLVGANLAMQEFGPNDPFVFNYPIAGGGGARSFFRVPDVQKWGWNFARITSVSNASPGGVSALVQKATALGEECRAAQIVCMFTDFSGGVGSNPAPGSLSSTDQYWRELCASAGSNPYVWINYHNEPISGDHPNPGWVALGDHAYQLIRGAGCTNTMLVLDAGRNGQGAPQAIGDWNAFAAGKHHVALSWHVYMAGETPDSLEQGRTALNAAGVPWLVGEFAYQPNHPGEACCGAASWDVQRAGALKIINEWIPGGESALWWHGSGDASDSAQHSLRTPDGTYQDYGTSDQNLSEAGAALWAVSHTSHVISGAPAAPVAPPVDSPDEPVGPPAPGDPAGDPAVDTGPAIVVQFPTPNARVGLEFTAFGTSNTFEATHIVQVIGMSGATPVVLAEQVVTASCGTGCRGTWLAEMQLPSAASGPAVFRAFFYSPEDGTAQNIIDIPIVIDPSLSGVSPPSTVVPPPTGGTMPPLPPPPRQPVGTVPPGTPDK